MLPSPPIDRIQLTYELAFYVLFNFYGTVNLNTFVRSRLHLVSPYVLSVKLSGYNLTPKTKYEITNR
jgi:hypothetical protein